MKRPIAVLALVVGAVVAVAGLVMFVATPAGKPLGPDTVSGAEPKDAAGAAGHFLVEYGPGRGEDPYSYWTERVVAPGQPEPVYRVCWRLKEGNRDLKVSEAQAAGLVKLHDFVKDKKKTPADVLTRARVVWEADGWQYQFTLEGSGEWRLNGEQGTALSIQTVSQLLKDIEAMKAVKPSISW